MDDKPLSDSEQALVDDWLDQYEECLASGEPFSVEEACRDYPHLRTVLEDRIAVLKKFEHWIDDTTRFHDARPIPAEGQAPNPVVGEGERSSSPNQIGPYRLVDRIGHGGQGDVWRAEQEHPIRRTVALKLIRGAADSRQVLGRFEAERQALAMMEHPHIAKILDAGSTPGGQPYFVMELVKGKPLTRHCVHHQLGLRPRLQLFLDVCDAVQHAHQKGIIHRDLKPSNVLVHQDESGGTAKVIDFGLAKAMDTRIELSENTVFTEFGAVMGTLLYMSPEQAGKSQWDMDTRSDVYSLGVMLYELLTGTTPLQATASPDTDTLTAIRMIREQDPPPPSAQLVRSTAETSPRASTTVSDLPLAKSPAFHSALRGELDWVVMKAIRKERGARYQTVQDFANDVRAFLDDQPVRARPPSLGYRIRKFYHRHRIASLAAAVVAVSLLVATGVSLAFAVEASREATRANEQSARATREARRATELAEKENAARLTADRRLQQIERSNEILASLFEVSNPDRASLTAEELREAFVKNLESAVESLDKDAIDDARVLASLRLRLGKALSNLGRPARAVQLFQESWECMKTEYGENHFLTLEVQNNLAAAYRDMGLIPIAARLWRDVFDRSQGQLELERDTQVLLNNVSIALLMQGQFEEAIEFFQSALETLTAEFGPKHPVTLTCRNNLGEALRSDGQLERAIPILEQNLKDRRAALPERSHDIGISLMNLGAAYRDQGRLSESIELLREAVALFGSTLPRDAEDRMSVEGHLARSLLEAGELSESIDTYLDLVDLQRERSHGFPALEAEFVVNVHNLAVALSRAQRYEEALVYRREAAQLKSKPIFGGETGLPAISSRIDLAADLIQTKQWEEATAVLRSAQQRLESNEAGSQQQEELQRVREYLKAIEQGRAAEGKR